MTEPLARLGNVSRAYQIKAAEYEPVAIAAAKAEAAHKAARAKAILRTQAEGERVSHATAETTAEADGEVAALYLERLVTAAKADAHKEQLKQLREQNANGRTLVTSAREVDRMHAEGRAEL
ncbi:hypothetical protein [Amycolatopsis sp. NPDC004079]|uniref:hypothetical protein n=1 Tax=Amycolatopsis sp. NPDC004079 TaxID=3154549 RepID=UPI0033A1AF68